jgi:hypothetical protein
MPRGPPIALHRPCVGAPPTVTPPSSHVSAHGRMAFGICRPIGTLSARSCDGERVLLHGSWLRAADPGSLICGTSRGGRLARSDGIARRTPAGWGPAGVRSRVASVTPATCATSGNLSRAVHAPGGRPSPRVRAGALARNVASPRTRPSRSSPRAPRGSTSACAFGVCRSTPSSPCVMTQTDELTRRSGLVRACQLGIDPHVQLNRPRWVTDDPGGCRQWAPRPVMGCRHPRRPRYPSCRRTGA